MKFKGILKDNYNFPNTSHERFYIGIFIGIIVSITFYLFFQASRESLRFLLSATKYYDLLILTDKETWFYNLIFAFISSIFGEGLCLKMWYEHPKQLFNSYFNYRRKSIFNDIIVLNTNFLFFFTKLALLYGIWLGTFYGYRAFSLYPKYNYLWILIIIVLHLEQWKTIRLVFKNKSIKGFILFTISITILSFFLAAVNPINYKQINHTFLSKSVDYNYELDRPISKYANRQYEDYDYFDLYFVYPKDTMKKNLLPTIIIDGEIIKLNELCTHIEKKRDHYPDFMRSYLKVKLHTDKNIKYKYLKELKTSLSNCSISWIMLTVEPTYEYYPSLTKRYYTIWSNILNYSTNAYEEKDLEYFNTIANIRLKIIDNDIIEINNKYYQIKNLPKILPQIEKTIQFRQIQLIVADNVCLQSYINIRDHLNKYINERRNYESIKIYNKPYNQLNEDTKYSFNQKYYFNFIELPDKLVELIEEEK